MPIGNIWKPINFPRIERLLGESALESFAEAAGLFSLRIWLIPGGGCTSSNELATIKAMRREAERIVEAALEDFLVGEISIEINTRANFVEGHVTIGLEEKRR
jgi:hypothetical protein